MLAVSDNQTTPGSTKDDNTIDSWGLAAKYDTHGFSMGATYWLNADALNSTLAASAGQTALSGV